MPEHEPGSGTALDTRERGTNKEGQRIYLDRRLFMQLLVFDSNPGTQPAALTADLEAALSQHKVPAVVYEDVSNPRGLAVLSFSEDPARSVPR